MESILRIGLVCYPTYGGSGVVATELGRWLAHRGHEVHFMSYDRPFRLTAVSEPNLHFHKVELFDYPVFPSPSYTLSLAVKIAEVAEARKLDIVHVHYAVPHAVSAYLARQMCGRCRMAVVTTLHGTDITLVGGNPALLPAVRFAVQQSDAVTAVSRWLRDHTIDQLEFSRPIEVVPNFVDADLFKPRPDGCPMRQFIAEGRKAILHVSNFRPVKRVVDIVRAFARIREQVDAWLVMVGDGPDRAKAEEAGRELGLLDRIRFLGNHVTTQCFYGAADLFLYASENEAFGLAALEAMSSAIPVVGYDGGGLPEVVRTGETGYLVPTGDLEALAERAIHVLNDGDRGREMGRRARETVLKNYLPDQVVAQYEAIYRREIAGPEPRSKP